ncbi:hypothetical protein GWK47_040967 [Chionoecetes opilio]|uniref:Uncharacterized protein n=1 Tax=Chionoecetes opilio TaxID=41210 RepID=A0A8J5CKZ5_CHIOP|nr:hypothetical protein GWK47_040967 [Chionoecetes opilio]
MMGPPARTSSPRLTTLEIMIQTGELMRVYHGVEMYNSVSRRGVNDYDLSAGVVATRPELLRQEIHYNQNLDEALFIRTEDPCIITGEEGCDALTWTPIMGRSSWGQWDSCCSVPNSTTRTWGPRRVAGLDARSSRPASINPTKTTPVCSTPTTGRVSVQDWDVENNGNSVPMTVDIVDSRVDGMTLHVEFFDYRREWMPGLDELEVPVDVFCTGRETYMKQPKTITTCFYKSEQVAAVNVLLPDGAGQTESVHMRAMFPQQEWYDYDRRISRRDYIPIFIYGANRRFENYTQEILEFNQELSYKVHPRLNTCQIKPIESNFTWGDIVVGPDGDVQMMNPWNWESLSEPMQYNGRHWVRGMTADVWVGLKHSPTLKLNETVVWYFASPFTNEILTRSSNVNFTLPTVDKVPIKFEKYLSSAKGLPHVIYNIYSFEGIIPLTHNHDVSLCFAAHQMRHFTFDLPHSAIESSLFLRENLKYAIQGALREAGNVSPLRINRVEVKQTKTAVKVIFTLLEKPSKVADVDGGQYESTMDHAADLIRDTIDESQLIILVKYGDKPDDTTQKSVIIASMTAHPHTMVEVTRDDEIPRGSEILAGYSSGDMAGLAVGMIILGVLMGYGGMYLYGRRS